METSLENVRYQTRMHWIDIAKCVGIFAIVYGHTIKTGWSCRYVYSFHVPLFFFLQGVVFRVSRADQKRFTQYLKSRSYTLLVPYFVFAIVSTIVIFVASKVIYVPGLDIFSSWIDIVLQIICGNCDANRPLWFLPCAYAMSIITYGLINVVNRQKNSTVKLVILICVAIVSGGALYVLEEFTDIKFLPWKLDAAVYMLPFFIVGYVLMEYEWVERIQKCSSFIRILVAFALIGMGAWLGLSNEEANYLGNYIGNILMTYLSAFASCIGICALSMLIPDIRLLTYVGKSTLCILLMHKFPVLLFQVVIPYVAHRIGNQSILTSVVVTVVTIALCCVAQWILSVLCPIAIGKQK